MLQLINPLQEWFVIGVSSKTMFGQYSFTDDTVYGISTMSQFYCSSGAKFNDIITNHFARSQCEIDILLDVDKGLLNICIVGMCDDKHEAKFYSLPLNTKHGWVPHFNFGTRAKDTQIRFASVPIEWYGQQIDDIWN